MNESFNVPSAVGRANASSTVLAFELKIVLAASSNRAKKRSFLATKSVSELTSNTTALLPSIKILAKPSAAILPSFLAALAIPFSRSQSIAFFISPSHSVRAFLQSIIPAPVNSRNSFT